MHVPLSPCLGSWMQEGAEHRCTRRGSGKAVQCIRFGPLHRAARQAWQVVAANSACVSLSGLHIKLLLTAQVICDTGESEQRAGFGMLAEEKSPSVGIAASFYPP